MLMASIITPKTGKTVTVLINNHSYPMYYDAKDELRFVGNPVVRKVLDQTMNSYLAWAYDEDSDETISPAPFSMHDITKRYEAGEFTFEQYLDFHALIGYTLESLKSLAAFEDVTVVISETGEVL
jgi:hypothetical protein